eukprot:5824069-Amphidinium_carterae.1
MHPSADSTAQDGTIGVRQHDSLGRGEGVAWCGGCSGGVLTLGFQCSHLVISAEKCYVGGSGFGPSGKCIMDCSGVKTACAYFGARCGHMGAVANNLLAGVVGAVHHVPFEAEGWCVGASACQWQGAYVLFLCGALCRLADAASLLLGSGTTSLAWRLCRGIAQDVGQE